jgi:hypothetical protein
MLPSRFSIGAVNVDERERRCSNAQDPAACEARAKAREQRRRQMMQARAGKLGDDLRSCMRAQRGAESTL